MFFLFLESLGTTEILVILVVALILFGPRRLPQLSRSLGKSLGEFKRASEDFKRTWEREVEMESLEKEAREFRSMLTDDRSLIGTEARSRTVHDLAREQDEGEARHASLDSSQASAPVDTPAPVLAEPAADAPASERTRKRDWL